MTSSITSLLDGASPIAPDAIDERLLLANVEEALFGNRGAPSRVGRYHVITRAGRGGGGTVYRGYDPDLDRSVAIKVLAGAGAEVSAVVREAEALARLDHPNVVRVYDVLVQSPGGRVVVIMQWIDGTAADVWLREHRPDVRQIVRAFSLAGRGLAAAHRAGLVHRDIKPANLLVGDNGEVRVADFGLARLTPTTAQSVTADASVTSSGVVGTPAYMAPEQWSGDPVTPAADQYAFCASLAEALHGHAGPVPAHVRRVLVRGMQADPSRRYPTMERLLAALQRPARRVVLPAAAAVAAVGLLAGAVTQARADEPSCAVAAQELETALRQSAASVGEALRASDARLAHDTARRVESDLTAYAAHWGRARALTCDDALSVQEADRRRRCLQSSRWQFESLAEVLVQSSADAVSNAPTAVAGLSSPDLCDAPADSGLQAWVPDQARARAQAQELRRELAEASAQTLAGQYQRAAESADELLARARQANLDPIALLALLELGRARVLAGDLEAGRVAMHDAYFAARAGGHDREAASAAIQLAFTVGYTLADPRAGLEWARHAEAAMDRLGLEGEPRAVLLNHRGSIAARVGDFERARRFHEAALAIREPAAQTRPTALAHSLNNLGNVALQTGDFETAGRYHRRALELRRGAYGPAHPLVATSLNNLGSVIMLADGPSEARATFEDALATWESALGPDHPDVLQVVHNLATVAWKERRGADHRALAERALKIAETNGLSHHPALARALDEVGLAELVAGRPERARVHYARALVTLRALYGSDHPAVAGTLNALGLALKAAGDDRAALARFAAAAAGYRRLFGPDHRHTVTAMRNEGLMYAKLGQPQSAIELLERVLEHPVSATFEPAERSEAQRVLAKARAQSRSK